MAMVTHATLHAFTSHVARSCKTTVYMMSMKEMLVGYSGIQPALQELSCKQCGGGSVVFAFYAYSVRVAVQEKG